MGNSGSVKMIVPEFDIGVEFLFGHFFIGDRNDVLSSYEEFSLDIQLADKMVLQAGADMSFANCVVPLANDIDENAFSVALKRNGPLDKIKPRCRAVIYYVNQSTGLPAPVLIGSVIDETHNLGDDTGILTVVDDKYVLEKVKCYGRVAARASSINIDSSILVFLADEPLIFNKDGLQDCIDDVTTGLPVFAPSPRYGWKYTDHSEPAPGEAFYQARSWRAPDILKYLKAFYHEDTLANRPVEMALGYNQISFTDNFVPLFIYWPDNLANKLSVADDPETIARYNRAVNHFDCEGKNMAEILNDLGEACGPFGLYMIPRSSGSSAGGDLDIEFGKNSDSEISFVNFSRKKGGNCMTIPGFFNSGIYDSLHGLSVLGGYVKENVRNYYDNSIIIGDAPIFEKTIETNITYVGSPPELSTNSGNLEAYTIQDAAWIKYVNTYYTPGTNIQAIINEANNKFPLAFIAFRIRAGYDYTEGTKWEGIISPRRTYAKILPHLITPEVLIDEINESEPNPANFKFKDIPVEVKNAGGTYVLLQQNNGFEISLDGTYFIIPALRDKSTGFAGLSGGAQWDRMPIGQVEVNCKRMDVRVCVAIQADTRMMASANRNDDPNEVGGRVDTDKYSCTELIIAKKGDYVDYLRGPNAKPEGSNTNLNASNLNRYPDKCTANDELFSDNNGDPLDPNPTSRLSSHVVHRHSDNKRITYSGQIEFNQFDPALVPGEIIAGFCNAGIDVRGPIKSTTIDVLRQKVLVELG